MSVYQLTPKELYQSYTNQVDPNDLVSQGRTTLATRLMVDEKMTDKDAYYAADQIFQYAQGLIENRGTATA